MVREEQEDAPPHHRLIPWHPVGGLALRDALLAQVRLDGKGMLGAIAFADFDRLTAFDPAFGERIIAKLTARLRAMMPRARLLAQVDRDHVGIWFGNVDERAARSELSAIAYALGEEIEDDGRRILPTIKVRLAAFDGVQDCEAGAFLSRVLASFALSEEAVAAAGRATADYAEVARDRFVLEQDLRQAIAKREFRLEFQPLIDAAQGRLSGAEALIRWDHPERGAISPGLFVRIAETAGLACDVGTWALNAAAREARVWSDQGLRNLRIAVNVSAHQLERDDLPQLVRRVLLSHELSCGALELELTESVATSDTEHCRRIFRHLREMGVKLAVDDFGTGYSGFSALRALAFDKIKIDREFVTDVDRRGDSQAICQSIVALGRGLGIRVLAEGVERREEYEWLRRHGCNHFQGYFFARPLSGSQFAAFVRDTDALAALLAIGGSRALTERLSA